MVLLAAAFTSRATAAPGRPRRQWQRQRPARLRLAGSGYSPRHVWACGTRGACSEVQVSEVQWVARGNNKYGIMLTTHQSSLPSGPRSPLWDVSWTPMSLGVITISTERKYGFATVCGPFGSAHGPHGVHALITALLHLRLAWHAILLRDGRRLDRGRSRRTPEHSCEEALQTSGALLVGSYGVTHRFISARKRD